MHAEGWEGKSTGRGLPTPLSPQSSPRSSWEVRSRLSFLRCYPHDAARARPETAFSHQDPGRGDAFRPTRPRRKHSRTCGLHSALPARATERSLGRYRDGRVLRSLSPGWARGLCAWVARSAPRALLAPSLAFSFFSFLFFFFLERSPAPGVWNRPDKLLSYGGGAARTPAARRAPIRREPGRRRQRPREPSEPGRPRARPPPPSQAFLSAEALPRSQRPGQAACRARAGPVPLQPQEVLRFPAGLLHPRLVDPPTLNWSPHTLVWSFCPCLVPPTPSWFLP